MGRLAAAAFGAALLMGAAPAAKADFGDFDDGFEDELGRIAAREVVNFGKFVLSGGGHGYFQQWGAVYQTPYRARAPEPRFRQRPHRRARAWRPWRPAAYPAPTPAYRPPPRYEDDLDDYARGDDYPEPCEHTQAEAPYGERIVYERYERIINPPPPTPTHRARY